MRDIRPETATDLLPVGSASSPWIRRFESVFDRDFDPAGFAFVRSDEKDVRLLTELAPSGDAPADREVV